MVSLFKGLFPGALLTWIVAVTAARQGAFGGVLNVHSVTLADWHTYWSWPMMAVATGLCWAVFWMLDGLR